MFFEYGSTEMEYLKSKDVKLAQIIDKVGHIKREVFEDLFCAIVNAIVGQQISAKAQETVWKRIQEGLGEVTPQNILSLGETALQAYGISFRKAQYITDCARKTVSGEIDLDAIRTLPDGEAIKELCKIKGIGVWTAEMILLFCLQRPNIFSFNDLAIKKGLCRIYHHRQMQSKLFEKYRRKFSPYCSVASLYIWESAKL